MEDHKGQVVYGNANAHVDKNLTPTVVLSPAPDSPMMMGEIFGPILPVVPVANMEEAVAYIRGKDKPLAAYYFGSNSSSNKNLKLCKEGVTAGAFVVNEIGMQMANSDLPFGGVGPSGSGRYHGRKGFESCSNLKSVLCKDPIKVYPYSVVFPPFTAHKQQIIGLLAKYDYTQAQIWRGTKWFIFILWLLWLVVTKRLSVKTFKKIKGIASLAWMMMRR
jgi:aldehyde dehydrogenase (NAD+)